MNRFTAGEIALGKPMRKGKYFYSGEVEVEVVEVGPYGADYSSEKYGISCRNGGDYIIKAPDWRLWFCFEHQLRKRPDDQPFTTWAKDHLIPYADCAPSLEESMKTAQKNLASYTQE